MEIVRKNHVLACNIFHLGIENRARQTRNDMKLEAHLTEPGHFIPIRKIWTTILKICLLEWVMINPPNMPIILS